MMNDKPKIETLQDIINRTRGSIDDASPSEWHAATHTNYKSQNAQFDDIQKPSHYNYGKYETIDVIIDTLGQYEAINYCHGNVLKYVIRMWHKGTPEKDAKKAQWYLNKMIELLSNTKGVNW
jgi:hypothetical protein